MRRRLPALLAGGLLALIATAVTAGPAGAHALLSASTPADGGSVTRPPTEMVLTFTEAPDTALSSVRVLDQSGEPVEAGKAEGVPGEPTRLRVPLGSLAEGTYTATWRVTSPADGHTTVGSVAFGVGVPAVAVGSAGVASVLSPWPTIASFAGRWLFYVGVVLMLGAAAVGAFVVASPASVRRRALVAAWVAAAAGSVLTMLDQRARARTSLGDLLSSATGHRLATQLVAVAMAGVAVAWAARRPTRWSLAAVGVGASGAMLARALAGHANVSTVRWFTVGTQWIHLVSVGAWVGGLAWVLIAMRRGDSGQGRGLARRFSSVATVMLALVVVSGVARSLNEVGAWARMVETDFGVTLLVKVGLVATLVIVGAFSHFRHVAAAMASRIGGLRRAVRVEVSLAALVLGATALLTGFPPPATLAAASRDVPPPAVTVTGNDYGTSVRVHLTVTPGSAGPNAFDAVVEDFDSRQPIAAESVALRFQLTGRPDVPAATLPLAREPDSHWRALSNALSIDGRWGVVALIQAADDAVEVPLEIVTRPAGQTLAPVGGGICGQGTANPSYTVTMDSDPSPPKAEGSTLRFTVGRAGRPVTGASVCVNVDMPAMQHPGVFIVATETGKGTYSAPLKFSMTGIWSGSVTIAEPGAEPVAVATRFEVE